MYYVLFIISMCKYIIYKIIYFINLNLNIFIPVLLLNWLMLLFGYLGEMNIIPVLLGVILGFIPFLIYYYIIYVNYVTQKGSGNLLFWY